MMHGNSNIKFFTEFLLAPSDKYSNCMHVALSWNTYIPYPCDLWPVKEKELHSPEVGGNLLSVMHMRTILNVRRKWNCINFPVPVFLYKDKY
jgi:hypothetical protein